MSFADLSEARALGFMLPGGIAAKEDERINFCEVVPETFELESFFATALKPKQADQFAKDPDASPAIRCV